MSKGDVGAYIYDSEESMKQLEYQKAIEKNVGKVAEAKPAEN